MRFALVGTTRIEDLFSQLICQFPYPDVSGDVGMLFLMFRLYVLLYVCVFLCSFGQFHYCTD